MSQLNSMFEDNFLVVLLLLSSFVGIFLFPPLEFLNREFVNFMSKPCAAGGRTVEDLDLDFKK